MSQGAYLPDRPSLKDRLLKQAGFPAFSFDNFTCKEVKQKKGDLLAVITSCVFLLESSTRGTFMWYTNRPDSILPSEIRTFKKKNLEHVICHCSCKTEHNFPLFHCPDLNQPPPSLKAAASSGSGMGGNFNSEKLGGGQIHPSLPFQHFGVCICFAAKKKDLASPEFRNEEDFASSFLR